MECSVVDGLTLAMNSASSKTKIKCISADEFPTISSIEEQVSYQMDKEGLPDSIHQVSFAASHTNTRPVLSGMYWEVDGDLLTLVATDSFRLSEKKIRLSEPVSQAAHCIIPTRAILEFARLCEKDTVEKVGITFGKNQVQFKVGSIELYSRLIEGNFPPYRQILPRSIRTSTSLGTSDQVLAVKRVNLFAKENNNKVTFDFQPNTLRISTPATQVGEEEGELPISLDGEPGAIALNSEFVLDVLSHLGADQVEIGINDSKSPAVFKAVGKDDFVHIIMPLKLQ
jgi:DNA polymerase-3 subunit beta